MALHFERSEFLDRRRKTLAEMATRGLAGLLMFRQESMYYLTGYDTFGFCFFQCLFLGADGNVTLLTRAPDLRQAQHTSIVEDIRVWVDQAGHAPALALRAILEEKPVRGEKVGIELDAYGLTAYNWRAVESALDGFCEWEDASDLVSRQRLVKSPRELEYVAQAASLADASLEAAIQTAAPGAFEGDILANMQGAVFEGGGDYPGNEFIIGSGRDALLCRYFTGRRHLGENDQLTLEFAGAYRHYHACLMRTIVVGTISPRQQAMYDAAHDALLASEEALRPGKPIGEVFDAHARVLDAAGFREHRMNACGYSLGATFAPIWMDYPMFYAGNPVLAEENMVFFLHMILADSASETAMTLGHTVRVSGEGIERQSHIEPLLLNV